MTARPHRCVSVDGGKAYCCCCCYRADDAESFAAHVEEERAQQRQPYVMTTIPSVDQPTPCGLEIHSTPGADDLDAVVVVVVVPDRSYGRVVPGRYLRHEVLVARDSLDFLIAALGRHRKGELL